MQPYPAKRAASEHLSRRSKQPRLALNRQDGETSSPSQKEGLAARWKGLFWDIATLGKDSISSLLGYGSTDMSRSDANGNSVSGDESLENMSGETVVDRAKSCEPQPAAGLPLHIGRENRFERDRCLQNGKGYATLHQGLPSSSSTSYRPARSLPLPSPAPSSVGHPVFKSPSFQHSSRPFQPFAQMPSPERGQRDTPIRRPPQKRKGSMGPPALPSQNSFVFPSSSRERAGSAQPSYVNGSSTPRSTSRASSVCSTGSKRERRRHILQQDHENKVKKDRSLARDASFLKFYEEQRRQGYQSDIESFQGLLVYQRMVETTMEASQRLRPSYSITDFRPQVAEGAFEPIQPSRLRRTSDLTGTPEYIRRSIENVRSTLNGPKPPPAFTPRAEQLRKITRARDVEIDKRLHPKLRPVPSLLPPADEKEVDAILQKNGVISKYEREQVSHTDIRRLLPETWLNDEIINFYGALMLGRSENNKENDKFPKAHYFSTFFWSKLEKDGYDKGRLAKWTKKFDLFSKDVVLIPVNHNNVHWTAAVINFKRKRIESYDSMGGCRPLVYAVLRQYLDAEHKNKKKKPFDFTGWTDHVVEDLPQQENAFDCGVFTCQFLQCVSRGEEAFNFSQRDIKYLRRRMIWEISHACLRDE